MEKKESVFYISHGLSALKYLLHRIVVLINEKIPLVLARVYRVGIDFEDIRQKSVRLKMYDSRATISLQMHLQLNARFKCLISFLSFFSVK